MRPAAAAALLLAAFAVAPGPATGATRGPLPAAEVLDIPDPTGPPRDQVLGGAAAAGLRWGASASAQRYPVNDGKGRTVAIAVSSSCSPLTCDAADPQPIADFLGTLVHGDEISLLTVELVADLELANRCGFGAGACYFLGADTMLINGSDTTGRDGASREFVIAHEYGHHLANHRRNPPFGAAIDWGTKRWATYERICQGVRKGVYFPGDQGSRYRQNPGEAFAEAFAFNRFRRAPVSWAWSADLEPDGPAFVALRRDSLAPWMHRTRFLLAGRVGAGSARANGFAVPLDGVLSVRLTGAARGGLDLILRDRRGRLLAESHRPGSTEQLSYTICGQARLQAVVVSEGSAADFTLVVRRP